MFTVLGGRRAGARIRHKHADFLLAVQLQRPTLVIREIEK